MQDLSGSARFGPWATSQHAGNTSAENNAMTAPGVPSEGVNPADVRPAPDVQAIDHPRVATARPHQGHDPAPWGGGTSWSVSSDDAGQSAGGWVTP